MAYKSLYRTYRPQTFQDVVGQEHIVKTLQNALTSDRVSHAYLFCGPRGTGKTTVAKLLAKAVNCLADEARPCGRCEVCLAIQNGTFPDVIELDAASNNGVDEIRGLIEKVKYAPLEGRFKVYIIDEVHMLSTSAFNALLKTLEEPPAHVIFILATTEAHKVLPTIISRCQRFDFKRVDQHDLAVYLEKICEREGIQAEAGVADLISSLSDGGVRDSLTLLEQCLAYASDAVKLADVYEIYGVTTPQQRYDLFTAIESKDRAQAFHITQQLSEKNVDFKRMINDFVELLKNAIVYSYSNNENFVPPMDRTVVQQISQNTSPKRLLYIIDQLMEVLAQGKFSSNVQSYFEVSVIKLMEEPSVQAEAVIKPAETRSKEQETIAEEHHSQETKEISPQTEMQQETPAERPQAAAKPETAEAPADNRSYDSNLDAEIILQYMVAANKEEKQRDIEAMSLLTQYLGDMKWMKMSNLLSSGMVVLSGTQFCFISVEYLERVNQIEDPEIAQEKLAFSQLLFGKTKLIRAITQEQFKAAVELFKERAKANQLPDPVTIESEHLELKSSSNEINEGLFAFLGDDVEIV